MGRTAEIEAGRPTPPSVEARRAAIEGALRRELDGMRTPEPLGAAIRHALLGPGKRLRPRVVLAAAEAVDRPASPGALSFACAVEMVHAYSLVHDDLPAMDDDDRRRGRPTVHRAFDEATAILAGDALLTQAFAVIGRAPAVPTARRAQAVVVLAEAAGAAGMVGGQVLDLAAEGRFVERLGIPATDPDSLLEMARRKTGALFGAAAVLGGIAAGARGRDLQSLRAYGETLGLAFQIADDLVDAATGRDVAQGKATFPAVLGEEAARSKAEVLLAEAVSIARTLPGAGAGALARLAVDAVGTKAARH